MARFERKKSANWQQRFLALLPVIVNYVRPAFRELGPEAKAEAVQEAVANALVAYARLVEQGRESLAFATILAKFAVSQVRAGRQVGGRLNAQDISSQYCQQRKRIRLGRLDRFDPIEGIWQETIVEDHRTPILDQVCFRIDFPAWLDSLPPRDRKIAQSLAEGLSTTEVARRFGLTMGRVSQLRREFEKSWLAFQGEEEEKGRIELLTAA
jgi:DNA-directed RNA polymerase specialized sigma24 family protein